MKTIDALREVSHDMELMAHYLKLASCDSEAGADLAHALSDEVLAMQQRIDDRLRTLVPAARGIAQRPAGLVAAVR